MLQCPSPTKVNPVSWMPRLIIVVCELQSTVHPTPQPLPPSIPPQCSPWERFHSLHLLVARVLHGCLALLEIRTSVRQVLRRIWRPTVCGGEGQGSAGHPPHPPGWQLDFTSRETKFKWGTEQAWCRTCWRLRSPLVQVLVLVPVLVLVSAVPVQG